MQIKIAPSILAADFSAVGDAVKAAERGGADLIHCDVMDGSFVHPITFGAQMAESIRPLTRLPLDCHLMVEHPKTQVKQFVDAGADIITVHYEACRKISSAYLAETLELIKSFGVRCGVAVNPNVPAERVFNLFTVVDTIIFMSVYPGYGGQKFMPGTYEQLKKARAYAIEAGRPDLDISVDGGVTLENCKAIREAGANVLVAGSAVYRSPDPSKAIAELRR